MNIVNITTTDFGGAYIAAKRIDESLKLKGLNSCIVVRNNFRNSDVIEALDTPLKRIVSKIKNYFNLLLSDGEIITDLFGADISNMDCVKNADVIVLHWVNSFISCNSILKLSKLGKPIVWILHDMWPITGGCHYDWFCGKFEVGCEGCPRLKHDNKLSAKNIAMKSELNEKVNITYVALCSEEKIYAEKSKALNKDKVYCISNPIDVEVFKPLSLRTELRKEINEKYNIDDKSIILFGAAGIERKGKGFRYLIEALKRLDDSYVAFAFGQINDDNKIYLPNINVYYLDEIINEREIVNWYNIADVMVVTSVQETFGYTCCEALACGTPVVGFRTTGLLDQIEHKKNGYLVELEDIDGLVCGIEYCVDNNAELSRCAREKIISKNSYDVIGDSYIELFNNMQA